MNKKDVLGSRPAAWIIWKMESIPHWEKPLLCKRRDLLYCFEVPVFGGIWSTFQAGNYSYFSSMFVVLFYRGLNLQIDCIFVMFDIKMISNVAQATFCKVFLLYTNYAILYILYSIHQQTTISSIYPYCSITYYTQYLVFNHSFKPQYIVLPWTVVPIRVLPAQAHARARTRFRVFLKIL